MVSLPMQAPPLAPVNAGFLRLRMRCFAGRAFKGKAEFWPLTSFLLSRCRDSTKDYGLSERAIQWMDGAEHSESARDDYGLQFRCC